MTHFKNFAGAGALLLGSVFSAAAEDAQGSSFPMTHECAAEALQKVFQDPIEIIQTEEGVGFMRSTENPDKGISSTVSATVLISEQGNLASTNVQVDLSKPSENFNAFASYTRPYGEEGQASSLSSNGVSLVEDISSSFSNKLDEALKECTTPQMLSNVVVRGPGLG